MKTIKNALLCGTLLAAGIIISSCSSAGYSKGSSASKGMEKTGSQVDAIVDQTQLTLTSLSNLVYNPAPDLVPQYKAFEGATKKLQSLSDSVEKTMSQMKARADAYFAEWDSGMTNISNVDLHKASEKRRSEVSSAFDAATEDLSKSKAAFDPFLADLKDIQQVLELDLTQGGINSIQKSAKSAIAHGEDLRAALTDASSSIRELAAKMASQGPAPEPES